MITQASPYGMDLFDVAFVIAAVAFNWLIAGILIATKRGQTELRSTLGIVFVLLGVPFGIVFVHRLFEGSDLGLLLALGSVLVYILVELLLDYVLKIDFRRNAVTHIPYIALEYTAMFSLIGISFLIDSVWGWIVSLSFWTVLGSLLFLFLGKVTPKAPFCK